MRPIDIETATFDVARRGYDRRQVDAYLARVAFAFRSAAHRYDIDWAKESCGCGSGHDLEARLEHANGRLSGGPSTAGSG